MCSLFFRVRIPFCFSDMETFSSFAFPSDMESATRYLAKAIILEADGIMYFSNQSLHSCPHDFI
jgi:hypothetical protein